VYFEKGLGYIIGRRVFERLEITGFLESPAMTREIIQASQALKRATDALQCGDKQSARHWAQVTVSMVPNMEDPWLIMAAVANPRASIVYLERALEIAPGSARALAGLQWARGRAAWEQTEPIRQKVD
jgi:hypothetical protein